MSLSKQITVRITELQMLYLQEKINISGLDISIGGMIRHCVRVFIKKRNQSREADYKSVLNKIKKTKNKKEKFKTTSVRMTEMERRFIEIEARSIKNTFNEFISIGDYIRMCIDENIKYCDEEKIK